MSVDKVAGTFDDWARRGRAQGMEEGHGKTAGPLLSALPVGEGKRFLDLGCGNGWACRFAADRGARAVGIDASAEMVDLATRTASEAGLDTTPGDGAGAEFHVGDFAKLEAPDGSFDIAWSMEALYYAPDPDAVLRELVRVLRPGGVFHMIIDHYTENEASHSWPEDTGLPMVLRSEAQWVQAFLGAGFDEAIAQRLRAAGSDVEPWKVEQGSLHVTGRLA